MPVNKYHWYDGKFYDLIIAPNQDNMFKIIKKLIESGKNMLDAGCGTGRFSFSVSDTCNSVLGIDLSAKNILQADKLLNKRRKENVSFEHMSLNELAAEYHRHFDYAVITYVIHEVDESERIKMLKDAALLADRIIIGDYMAPPPKGLWSILNKAVEFAAGKEHYRNFRNYIKNGGLNYIIARSGLNITKEIKNLPLTSHIIMLEK